MLAVALTAGAVVGFAMGTLGGGGGVLLVPVLIYLLDMPPMTAATVSLVIVSLTSVTALARHARGGDISWRTGLLFSAAGVPVSAGAAILSPHLPAALLTVSFAVLAGVAAVVMLANTPAETTVPTRSAPARAMSAGAGLGAVTGLLGVGGGFLAVPTLVTALSLRMREAIGTSLLVIAVNSLAALGTRLATEPTPVNWSVIGPFAATAILAAWDGRRLSTLLSAATLRRGFGVLLAVVSAGMLMDVATT